MGTPLCSVEAGVGEGSSGSPERGQVDTDFPEELPAALGDAVAPGLRGSVAPRSIAYEASLEQGVGHPDPETARQVVVTRTGQTGRV